MLFDFFDMADNYEQRKVDHFEKDGLIVDTAAVSDSSHLLKLELCTSNIIVVVG